MRGWAAWPKARTLSTHTGVRFASPTQRARMEIDHVTPDEFPALQTEISELVHAITALYLTDLTGPPFTLTTRSGLVTVIVHPWTAEQRTAALRDIREIVDSLTRAFLTENQPAAR